MTGSACADFADSVRADASQWDAGGAVPAAVIAEMARAGFLAADVPAAYGGAGRSQADLGELCAQLGGVCSALRSLVTVQGMVAAAVLRWGTADQRARWLPALASGDLLAAFAATEPGAGSDLSAVAARLEPQAGQLALHGAKAWVTFGEVAEVFLVLARLAGKPAAVLVEAGRPGLAVEPVRGQLGLRAAQLAHVRFDRVLVPRENLLAPPGFGLSHVIATALDHGRHSVAWGCTGMAEACLRYAAAHAAGRSLDVHQAVRAVLGRCLAAASSARQVCAHAAGLREQGAPEAIAHTVLAKYAAARAASFVSESAVQLHGAAGCAPDSPVGRLFRDARVMRIIEGSDEVAEQHLGSFALQRLR